MSELTCDVVFYKNVNHGYINCSNVDVGAEMSEVYLKDSVEVGRTTVTVDLKYDTTPEEIAALEKEKQRIGIEAQVKMNNIEERIQSMLSIEHKQ